MKNVSCLLTDFVIHRGMAEEDGRKIYEYGFQIFLEAILAFTTSIIISLFLNMPLEGLIFFMVFIPLRIYAGGVHLEHFFSCFVCSCMVFFLVLYSVKIFDIPTYVSALVIFILLYAIWKLCPVKVKNIPMDPKEELYFKSKLQKIILTDSLASVILLFMKMNKQLLLVMLVLLVVAISMLLGKLKYS